MNSTSPLKADLIVHGHLAADSIASASIKGSDFAAITPPRATKFVIDGVVTLHADGQVEFAEGVTLDAAAREFWAAVQRVAPGFGDPA